MAVFWLNSSLSEFDIRFLGCSFLAFFNKLIIQKTHIRKIFSFSLSEFIIIYKLQSKTCRQNLQVFL